VVALPSLYGQHAVFPMSIQSCQQTRCGAWCRHAGLAGSACGRTCAWSSASVSSSWRGRFEPSSMSVMASSGPESAGRFSAIASAATRVGIFLRMRMGMGMSRAHHRCPCVAGGGVACCVAACILCICASTRCARVRVCRPRPQCYVHTRSVQHAHEMHRAHDLTVDWCWPNLANTWICLVLDWANTWLSGLLSIPLRRAPRAVLIHSSAVLTL
jgi:hypothetical protein